MSAGEKAAYRDLKGELDDIMTRLQQPDLDIDEALKLYKRGLELIQKLEEYLKSAKNQVTVLKPKIR